MHGLSLLYIHCFFAPDYSKKIYSVSQETVRSHQQSCYPKTWAYVRLTPGLPKRSSGHRAQQCFWAHPRNKEWKVRCVSQAAQGQSSQLSPRNYWPLWFIPTKVCKAKCIYYIHEYISISIYIYIYAHTYTYYLIINIDR